MTDGELVSRVVLSIGLGRSVRQEAWRWVSAAFMLGEVRAALLCQRFGVEPDERRGGCPGCDSYTFVDGGKTCCFCAGGLGFNKIREAS